MPRSTRPYVTRALAALTASALLVAGVVVAPSSITPPAAAAFPDTFNPFAISGNFTVYAREDLTLGNDETEGSLAAGGVATKPGEDPYQIIHVAAGTSDYTIPLVDGDPTRLLAGSYSPASGGIMSITSAGTSEPSLLGDLKMVERDGPFEAFGRADWLRLNTNPSNVDQTPLIDATAQDYPADATPPLSPVGSGSIYTFDTSATAVADYVEASREASYEDAASCLEGLSDTGYPVGIADDAGDRVVLDELSPDQPNVVNYDDIAGATLLQFSEGGAMPGGDNPLIIRVSPGTTEVVGARVDPQGVYSPYIMWDLSQSTGDVSIVGERRIDGSIYAPNANITVDAAPLDGQVIGQNVILEGGEVHSFLFAGTIACSGDSGSFRIRKSLEGIDPADLPADTSFAVNFTATEPDGTVITDSLELTPDGEWADPAAQYPTGTVITFEEIDPATVPGYEWSTPTITPDEITVGTGTADVIVSNVATAIVGTFSVSKVIEDVTTGETVTTEGSVPVTWTATFGGEDIGAGVLDVPLDGTVIEVGTDFPEGTEIVLAEDFSGITPPDGVRWIDSSWDPSDTFTIERDTTTAVTLTNTVASEELARTISIVKSATDVDPAYEYAVSYNTNPEGTRVTVPLPVSDPVGVNDLETGAENIELAELVPTLNGEPTDPADWELPVFVVTIDGETEEFTPENFEGDGPLETAIETIPLPASGDIVIEVVNERKVGTFELSKDYTDVVAENVPAFIRFSVAWTATTPTGEVSDGVVRMPGDGTPVSPRDDAGVPLTFPYGTVITYEELDPPGQRWLTWATPELSPTELVIGTDDEATVAATITNDAALRTGTFAVAKQLSGVDADELLVDSFTIQYRARLPFGEFVEGEFEIPADGTPAGPTVDGEPVQFPLGTIVRVEEVAPTGDALPPGYEWAVTTWSPSSFVLTRADRTVEIEVTNSVEKLTRFSVEKQVAGDASALVPGDTTFPVVWSADFGRERTLDAGIGVPAVSPYLPVGSTISLREGELPVIDGVEWGPVSWSSADEALIPSPGGGVLLRLDGDDPDPLELTMTNTALVATADIDDLPVTGAEAISPLVPLGALLLVAVGTILVVRRRVTA